MPNGRHPYPYFRFTRYAAPQLEQHGRRGFTLFAETTIRLARGHGSKRRSSDRLLLRLDTAAFVSLLPEEWMNLPSQARLSPISSERVSFQTAAGQGEGTLLSADTDTIFTTDPQQQTYRFDWLVTRNLNGRGYGLVAPRDLIPHFFIRSEGLYEPGPLGEPVELPDLELVPRQVWDRVRYRCPVCGIFTWGRAGLHLICGDHNVRLIQD
jgi:hypothetical protein